MRAERQCLSINSYTYTFHDQTYWKASLLPVPHFQYDVRTHVVQSTKREVNAMVMVDVKFEGNGLHEKRATFSPETKYTSITETAKKSAMDEESRNESREIPRQKHCEQAIFIGARVMFNKIEIYGWSRGL